MRVTNESLNFFKNSAATTTRNAVSVVASWAAIVYVIQA